MLQFICVELCVELFEWGGGCGAPEGLPFVSESGFSERGSVPKNVWRPDHTSAYGILLGMAEKNSAAVELGRLGGQKKVPKGFAKMNPVRLAEVAKKAAEMRWPKKANE